MARLKRFEVQDKKVPRNRQSRKDQGHGRMPVEKLTTSSCDVAHAFTHTGHGSQPGYQEPGNNGIAARVYSFIWEA